MILNEKGRRQATVWLGGDLVRDLKDIALATLKPYTDIAGDCAIYALRTGDKDTLAQPPQSDTNIGSREAPIFFTEKELAEINNARGDRSFRLFVRRLVEVGVASFELSKHRRQ